MTAVGDIIQPGQSIPEDVTDMVDAQNTTGKDWPRWVRHNANGTWDFWSIPERAERWRTARDRSGRPSDVLVAEAKDMDWAPFAVTAVREQPAEPEPVSTEIYWPVGTPEALDNLRGVFTSLKAATDAAAGVAGLEVTSIVLDRSYPTAVEAHDPTLAEPEEPVHYYFTELRTYATSCGLGIDDDTQTTDEAGKATCADCRAAVDYEGLPAEPESVDVLDLAQRYAQKVAANAITAVSENLSFANLQAQQREAEALFARIEAEVNRLRAADSMRAFLLPIWQDFAFSDEEPGNAALARWARRLVEHHRRGGQALKASAMRTDELRAEVERLNAEAERVTDDLVKARDERDALQAMLVEIAPAPDPSAPLVLSLPKVPEGAVALQGGARWVRSPYLPDSWVLDGGSVPHMLGALLDAEDGSVTVVMPPPREPRTWPALPGDPEGVRAVRGQSGRVYQPHGGFWVWRDGDDEVNCDSFVSLQNYDGPLVEVFDDKDGTR